jgi:hypothetical protein
MMSRDRDESGSEPTLRHENLTRLGVLRNLFDGSRRGDILGQIEIAHVRFERRLRDAGIEGEIQCGEDALTAGHGAMQFIGIGAIELDGFDLAKTIQGRLIDIADEDVVIAAAREKIRDRASDFTCAEQQHLMHEMTPKIPIDNIDMKGLEVNYLQTKGFVRMSTLASNPLEKFAWQPQPEAEKLIREIVADFLSRCPAGVDLARRMKDETGTRFYDWISFIWLDAKTDRAKRVESVGYEKSHDGEGFAVYDHPEGMFPSILIGDGETLDIGIKVESVADFLATNNLEVKIIGEPFCDVRLATIAKGEKCTLKVIERHGSQSWQRPEKAPSYAIKRIEHLDAFRRRKRDFENDQDGFANLHQLIDAAIKDLGRDLTCDLFFTAEREFWMRRNHAAQVQKARQDRLGLGWANHDHHTYRSSRQNFKNLIAVHEKLGLVPRERYYSGRQAGWGAQIMQQPITGIVTFNDVDLSPDELMGDFSHDGLQPREQLCTVGLWCALHGEAILQAGMHHLEAQFDFEALRDQLQNEGVKTMNPFTNFSYLRQAFTEGERWPVREDRIKKLLEKHQITEAQAKDFRDHGAIGSHLENLERNEGFKGFNQTGVSEIIAATDPRKQTKLAGA